MNPNDSICDNVSVEETSPFSSDVAVRRRTMDRLDSVVSVGSRLVCRDDFEMRQSIVG